MKRDIDKQLEEWKKSARRKPLIINGARQVGKTYALRHFGRASYKKTAYLNFEKDEKLSGYFKDSLDPKQLIKILQIHTNVDIEPHNTLLVFDEIQECPKALNSLKYFCEEANEYHIAAAGSLLGVKTAQEEGFPVGKVNFRPVPKLGALCLVLHKYRKTYTARLTCILFFFKWILYSINWKHLTMPLHFLTLIWRPLISDIAMPLAN